ncbi:hypothetical protein AB6A40_001034 [Gnathostoma spinigerum]|uniref:Small ribosomal subunit protein mS31 n=1 Tax=Gnathostoma spinigerum TaxID=75299 RepID=A0ABD6EDD8_9BILA
MLKHILHRWVLLETTNHSLNASASQICQRLSRFKSSSSSGDSDETSSLQVGKFVKSDVFDPKPKDPQITHHKMKPKDVMDDELLDAVTNVAKELHKSNNEMQKKTKEDLIARLTKHEEESFETATQSLRSEMLSDSSIAKLLSDVAADKPQPMSRAAEIRHARRGLVLLRSEIFYQAKQSGYSASEAQKIAERAVALAEKRVIEKHKEKVKKQQDELDAEKKSLYEANEKEQKFYDYAFKMASKMLYGGDRDSKGGRTTQPELTVVEVDPKMENIFVRSNERLGIFDPEEIKSFEERHLNYWKEWDSAAARLSNESFGPKNGFEEMIEWTNKGKMWPYPIDNEYLMGEESEVGFHEHIFLERTLSQYDLPRTGPIAHFMELVCVGLSKNPYMTAKRKREHLEWFVKFFDEKMTAEIQKLHDQEQKAAEIAEA